MTDVVLVSSRIPSFFPDPPYDGFADINGNHSISVTDVVVTAADVPSLLPAGEPVDACEIGFALALVLPPITWAYRRRRRTIV